MDPLRFVTLNINTRFTLDRVLAFLAKEQPDVVCLQEVCEVDLELFVNLFPKHVYGPITRSKCIEWEDLSVGFAVLCAPTVRMQRSEVQYYVDYPGPLVRLDSTTMESRRATEKRGVAISEVEKRGIKYRFASTHFSWVPAGEPDDYQRQDVRRLLSLVGIDDVILCGDFNAARGGEIFGVLARNLKDNIPSEHDSSIDPELHRVRGLRAMVDGVFSSPGYQVSNVRLHFGLSDHAAISGEVLRS